MAHKLCPMRRFRPAWLLVLLPVAAVLVWLRMQASAAHPNPAVLTTVITPAQAIVRDAAYPEGPLWLADGRIFYAEMGRDRISVWHSGIRTTFWQQSGCGPTSIAVYGLPASPDSGFVILCHLSRQVILVSPAGETRQILSEAENVKGVPLQRPNDSVADGKGGVYISGSGEFDPARQPAGVVYYLAPEIQQLRRVAEGIKYSNGLSLTSDGFLLVSAHLGRQVLRYPVHRDGSLGTPAVWVDFHTLPAVAVAERYALAGPDGQAIDACGNVLIAEYGHSRIVIYDAGGQLHHILTVPGKYVTNMDFSPDGRQLVITAPRENIIPPFAGDVYVVPYGGFGICAL
jgi:gluconolactonase